MIEENVLLEELKEIFINNKQNYLSDKTAIDSNMLKVVFVEGDHALGYAVVYEGNDFLEKEKFDVSINNIPDDAVYIWQVATKIGYEGQGIATQIINYITEKFKNRNIYSCVDVTNVASLKCHKKCGFKELSIFDDEKNGEKDTLYILLKN